jgi:glutamate synthase domain-containing protein 1
MLHRNHGRSLIRRGFLLKRALGIGPLRYDSSACGVALIVNLPNASSGPKRDHQLVKDITHVVGNFTYRAGINEVTGESDGAGVRFYTLPTKFFQKKIDSDAFRNLEGTNNTKPTNVVV